MNPLSNMLANSMRAVIKQKVHSALCNPELVEKHNKAMYETTRNVYDPIEDAWVEKHDPCFAQRTHHGEIQPAAQRIKAYRHRSFGKKYDEAVERVKQKDYSLSVMKKQRKEHGLMTAQLGSIYDIPINVTDQSTDVGSSVMESTKAGSSMHFSDTTGNFCQTEGAKYKPSFKVFYTNSEQEVQHVSVNKFEGRSNYFSYYPSTDLAE